MRNAILISGLPRFKKEVLESILSNVVSPNKADVFGHFWNNNTEKENMAMELFYQVFRDYIVTVKTEPQVQFNIEKYKQRRRIGGEFPANCFATISQFYSLNQCNGLKIKHEQDKEFKYDWVIRCRPDLHWSSKLDVSILNSNKLYISDVGRQWAAWTMMEDLFAVGNSSFMDIYCDFYNHIDHIFNETGLPLNPEEMLTCWIQGKQWNPRKRKETVYSKGNNISWEILPVNFKLVRGL